MHGGAVAFPSSEDTVRQALKAWAAGDVDRTVRYLAEDAVYALHISEDLLPFGGETVGRANIEAAFRQMRDQFEYLVFRPHNISGDGNAVRLSVEHMYRHRASGAMLTGNFRLVMQVSHGKITRCEEYHDRAMVETFMRLFGGK